ncbi:MAG: hypothetical protein ABI741_06990 [Ferruginibacter sp.]
MPSNLQAGNYQDTAIKGVRIQFTYRPSIFPLSWLNAGINAKGEPILPGEISRVKMLMVRALSKYPDTVLQKELRAVYFLRSMSMYNVIYGGTNSRDAVYLTDNGVDMGYTDAFIEQTFHHEFSSILYRNYPALLDTMVWKAANIPNFDYNDPEGGLGAIRKDESSQDLDTALCRIGFLTQYAYSDMENDVNTIAQNLFKPSPGFWNIVNTYPRIKEKVRLLVNFYIKISSGFNQQFFMKMN